MAEAEQPERRQRQISVADIHQLVAGVTPHFSLQIRSRIERLIAELPTDDPVRVHGESEMERLASIAFTGQVEGTAPAQEQPLPSLDKNASAP